MDDFLQHNWARPNAEYANNLININLKELSDSFLYLAKVCDYNQPDGLVVCRQHLTMRSDTALFFLAHESLLRAAHKQDQQECHRILESLAEQSLHINQRHQQMQYSRYGLTYSPSIEALMRDVMGSDHEETYKGQYKGTKSTLFTPEHHDAQDTIDVLKAVHRRLQRVDVTHFNELNTLIQRVVLLGSNGLNASTYISLLGAFFLRTYEPEKEHWERLLEHTVHESAHNLLYHLWYQIAPITDDEGVYYTPVRRDCRPLSGVYHAMFVLARTIYGFEALLNKKLLQPEDIQSHYNEANNDTPFKEKFRQTAHVLASSGKLTEFGSQLLADCSKLVNDCCCDI
ncbi:HEXXH motif-containing putative peptide modification protein [Vibrio brasiliensis]|uniref:aKG-HExxH-type peptide beta-hydroxylase n=1 Tax=Vibrio brasiliensis TaxID=170652 RepID=UPI001EFC65E9|nr:HEXXH motif-containing putative peptide modification protein [Vibrio brasiliensis]MCG9781653.1 HEXXH motif-containing putative peptide modification protein [Vibrio brasiliensis]